VHLGTLTVLRTVGTVVIKTDNLDIIFLDQPPGVVLEAELGTIGHFEVRTVTVQPPNDGAVGAIDLVNGASIAGRDQVVTVSVFVYRVDVEVVPGVGRVVARASLARVDGKDGLCRMSALGSSEGTRRNLPSGCTWSRDDHSKSSSPVAMSSSEDESAFIKLDPG
jgi:hypothetical protein